MLLIRTKDYKNPVAIALPSDGEFASIMVESILEAKEQCSDCEYREVDHQDMPFGLIAYRGTLHVCEDMKDWLDYHFESDDGWETCPEISYEEAHDAETYKAEPF